MKRLIAAGFLSMAVLGLATAPASALFHHCCDKCCSYICCRQYNAFTPVCFGSISCIGCCPIGNGAPLAYPPGLNGCCDPCADGCCGPSCGSGDCCGVGELPAPGSYPIAPPAKGNGNPNAPSFTPPMPTPADGNPMPPASTSMRWPSDPRAGQVMPTSFQPGYYPQAYPGYWPTMPMPYPQAASPAFNAFSGN
jgi:hypothetical protein